jgi:hypothetical protein
MRKVDDTRIDDRNGGVILIPCGASVDLKSEAGRRFCAFVSVIRPEATLEFKLLEER